jgi:hypothetical protein
VHQGGSAIDTATRDAVHVLLRLTTTDTQLDTEPSISVLLQGAGVTLGAPDPQVSLSRAVWFLGTLQKCAQVDVGDAKVKLQDFVQVSTLQAGSKMLNAAELFLRIPKRANVERLVNEVHQNLRYASEVDAMLLNVKPDTWQQTEDKINSLLGSVSALRLLDLFSELDKMRAKWAHFAQESTDDKQRALTAYFSTKAKSEADEESSLGNVRRLFVGCANEENMDEICTKMRELDKELDKTCKQEECGPDLLDVSRKLKDLLRAPVAFGRAARFV